MEQYRAAVRTVLQEMKKLQAELKPLLGDTGNMAGGMDWERCAKHRIVGEIDLATTLAKRLRLAKTKALEIQRQIAGEIGYVRT